MRFKNRQQAGRMLAKKLSKYPRSVIYALPRGGVVLGAVIAKALGVKLDLVIPRKIGHPLQPEYGIGAVTEHGDVVENPIETKKVDQTWLREEIGRQIVEANRRRVVYCMDRPAISATGKTAIIVDDGIATGLTMQAAILAVSRQNPAKIIIAVPIIPSEIATKLATKVDEIVALEVSDDFSKGAVAAYYDEFPQLTDEQVIDVVRGLAKGST